MKFLILGLFALGCILHNVSGQYDYDEVLHKSILFYEAQRSGPLPSNNRIDWRGDSALDDQGNSGEDLTGGWYDAGDHVKFNFPMAQTTTTLAWGGIEFRAAYESAGEFDNLLDSLRWPLDYFIKCHTSANVLYGQVGDGNADHAYWGRPEDMTMARPAFVLTASAPGSDLAGETAAALAASSILFRDSDSDYADTLLQTARSVYDFAYNYRGMYTDSIQNAGAFYRSSGYEDELAWGAAWLYRATNENIYLTRALEFASQNDVGWAFSWDSKIVGYQLLLYSLGQTQFLNPITYFLNNWFPGGSVPYTPQGLAWLSQWGATRYSANSAFIALIAAQEGILASQSISFAQSQIHYMLGDTGRSYVIGFGSNTPQRPHHRSSSCQDMPAPCDWDDFSAPGPNPQILDGALVGGPDQNDEYNDERDDYISNEVACDYNAGFQGAVAGLIAHGL